MPVDIQVPAVGESITEGTLSRWFKRAGEAVRADEPLYELETMKATTTIAAPASGTLHTSVKEGDTVAVGAVIGRIDDSAAPAPSKESAKVDKPSATPPAAPKAEPATATKTERDGPAPVMPAARRLAEETGVDATQVRGTGRGGRVLKEDVQHTAQQPPAAPPEPKPSGKNETAPAKPPTGERETRQRMSSIRQRISERLLASQNTTASLTTFNEADMSAVMALRTLYKDRFKEKHGVGLGFMSFFVKAAVEALKAHPLVNARIDGSDIVTQHFYDIGMAVSTERGLMVPILRDADQLSFAAIEQSIASMAAKARDGKITVQDLQGGTFTITNGGVFGSMLSTPILNPPQSAILGLHAIQKRPMAVNDEVVIRPMMYLALTYDHRLIDGREAVLFLVRIKECIENPERLLLEV
ncbi:MAG: 2-oxoglutarate dehydrogenase complex dihydrolipoyllysine-residue succinyltransferase [Planctomycetia bacterium]|nr:2-oxoglutarate dehydrogenase complex dihydrolipoyllysine-residue succinyltransferase [Planctomycetia bacterium]